MPSWANRLQEDMMQFWINCHCWTSPIPYMMCILRSSASWQHCVSEPCYYSCAAKKKEEQQLQYWEEDDIRQTPGILVPLQTPHRNEYRNPSMTKQSIHKSYLPNTYQTGIKVRYDERYCCFVSFIRGYQYKALKGSQFYNRKGCEMSVMRTAKAESFASACSVV